MAVPTISTAASAVGVAVDEPVFAGSDRGGRAEGGEIAGAAGEAEFTGTAGAKAITGAGSTLPASASTGASVVGMPATSVVDGGAGGGRGIARTPAAAASSVVLSGAMGMSVDVSVGTGAALIRVASRSWKPDAASPDDPCGTLGAAGAIMDSRAWADMVLK
jgi:hypothetical protein